MRNRKSLSWAVYFVFFVSLITFVVVPFSGDVEVFLGGSRLANYFGKGLIYNSFNVWEIKGVFTRLFFYILYNVTSFFASCPSMEFSTILSLIYSGMVIVISWIIACNILAESQQRKDRFFLTALISVAFFAVDSWCKMQAEMTCSLLLLLSLALALKKGKHRFLRLVISGMIISFMFWFKAPLLLLSVCLAAGIMLLSDNKTSENIHNILIVAASALVFLFLVGLLVYYINPDEYRRMLMASIYQGTLVSGNGFSFLVVLRRFIAGFLKDIVTLPILLIGAACLIVNITKSIQGKEFAKAGYHFIVWVIPALYVMISNCYFMYHYLTFMPAAIIEIWLLLNQISDTPKYNGRGLLLICVAGYFICTIFSNLAKPIVYYRHIRLIIVLVSCIMLIFLFLLCALKKNKKNTLLMAIPVFALMLYFTYSAILSHNSLSYIDLKKQSYSNDFSLPMENDEKMLYLDAGDGAYYFGYNTYYEEFYPLILQRIDEGSERSEMQRYVEASEKILSYKGKYICLTEDFIFPDGKNPTLKKKIKSEYEKVKSLDVYFTPTSIFELQSEANKHQLDIYKRKG